MSDVVVPQGWGVASVADVATSSGGGTPSKGEPDFWAGGTIPWVSPKDMKRFLIREAEDQVTEKALHRLGLIPSGSVLVVVRSGILSRTFPVAINETPVTINQDMRAFVPGNGIDARFLAWQLIANERDVLNRCAKDGTTVASIEGPSLAAYQLMIAPAAEQRRIVDKLEELLSDLDAAVAELKAAQRKLARYRQSLLKAAVEGALTADWRAAREAARSQASSFPRRRESSDLEASEALDSRLRGNDGETGAELLKRILAERRARWEQKQLARFAEQRKSPPKDWRKDYSEPAKADAATGISLPVGWVWATLEQLSEFITSGSRGWAEFYAESGATFIRSQNINKDRLDLTDAAYVNPPSNSEGSRTRVQRDDLLLTITGANVGKAATVDADLDEAYVSQHVALIRPVLPELASYLHLHLTCNGGGRGQLDKHAYGAGKPGLNLQQVSSVRVPLPGPEELQILLGLVSTALEAASTQEATIVRAVRLAAAQRKNILKAAFSGQLVPQDPNDEPASVLLDRIRASRTHGDGTTAKRRGRKARAEP